MTLTRLPVGLLVAAILSAWAVCAPGDPLPLTRAESIALDRDPGYTSLIEQSRAMAELATADSQLPDPMFSFGWLNVPVEDFNLGQEPMSQVRLGVKQTFPAGDTLAMKRDSDLAGAGSNRQQAAARALSTLLATRQAWLEVQYGENALSVLRRNEQLFRQLREITGSLYRTGKKALNDVVRAELELQRLKDREIATQEMIARQRAMLSRWVGPTDSQATLPNSLPDWQFDPRRKADLAKRLPAHPLLRAMDDKVTQMRAGVSLAEQQYKPSWSLELGYAFRNARRANGTKVSNVASAVASVNLPVFTRNRQDKQVSAASARLNATLDNRNDLLNKLASRLDTDLVRIENLDDRIALHRDLIIPQAKEQARAALMAYKANRADFAEVMRSSIAELDSTLALRRLRTDRLEAIAAAWYLVPPPADLARTEKRQQDPGAHHEH